MAPSTTPLFCSLLQERKSCWFVTPKQLLLGYAKSQTAAAQYQPVHPGVPQPLPHFGWMTCQPSVRPRPMYSYGPPVSRQVWRSWAEPSAERSRRCPRRTVCLQPTGAHGIAWTLWKFRKAAVNSCKFRFVCYPERYGVPGAYDAQAKCMFGAWHVAGTWFLEFAAGIAEGRP